MEQSELCWIWLSGLQDVSLNSKAALLETFGTAEAVWQTEPGTFYAVDGVSRKDADLLEKRDLTDAERICRFCAGRNIRILTMEDPAYPERLRPVYAAPGVLYVRGCLPEIDREPLVAIVGTRDASPYGLRMSRKIAAEYTECGGTVVSGLTRGIDSAAAEGALEAGGRVIGFLGTDISEPDSPLAERVVKNGALISEYAPGTPGQKYFFRQRNRIGAGISVAVAAIEAPRRSGTVLFVREALEQGKQIFAVPGNADSERSEGTLRFIKEGAQLITDGAEIARELEREFPEILNRKTAVSKDDGNSIERLEALLSGLSEIQKKIVSAVAEGCGTVEELTGRTGMPAPQLLSQLTLLEIRKVLGRNDAKQIIIPALTAK